ncbi:MAG: c-type cytochrome domain-containing protein [Planctomycetota bacterium]
MMFNNEIHRDEIHRDEIHRDEIHRDVIDRDVIDRDRGGFVGRRSADPLGRLVRHRSTLSTVVIMAILGSLAIPRASFAQDKVDFTTQVMPVLQTYCVACHTADDPQGGLVMEDYAALMNGGDSGSAVTAGEARSSRLYLMAAGELEPVMPPDDAEGPNEDELEILERWINEGAHGPEGQASGAIWRFPKITSAADLSLPVTALASAKDVIALGRFGNLTLQNFGGDTLASWDIDSAGVGKINRIAFVRNKPELGKPKLGKQELLVASGVTGGRGLALLLDAGSGKVLQRFEGHRDVLYAIAISPDGARIATGGYDRQILLWDRQSGENVAVLKGHNGAIYDLDFSPDGRFLVSASSDETAKVWNVAEAKRVATLGQPEGEVFASRFVDDGKSIVAISGDNRLRVWEFSAADTAKVPALVATRFIDESPLTHLVIRNDGKAALVGSAAGRLKCVRTSDWLPVAELKPVPDAISDLAFVENDQKIVVAMMNGQRIIREMPGIESTSAETTGTSVDPVFLDLGPINDLGKIDFDEASKNDQSSSVDQNLSVDQARAPEDSGSAADLHSVVDVGRNVQLTGVLSGDRGFHDYRFRAAAGEVWAIDADAVKGKTIDPKVAVLNDRGEPIIRVRLQAVRDTYFTFRGKNSTQANDFRLFNWQEIGLNEYLYSSGEVTRTWMHPRGPDSGFNVYPGRGTRRTYFGTPHTTHALGEPAYVVRQLQPGEAPEPNGLPVFEIPFENDDDPCGRSGNASRLLFTAPADGMYRVRVMDNRGWVGGDYQYMLKIRPATPMVAPSISKINPELRPGAGREFEVRVSRLDGYEGPVEFSIEGLPEGVESNFPVTIEAHQEHAVAVLYLRPDHPPLPPGIRPTVVASAEICGRRVQRNAGTLPELKVGGVPKAVAWIEPTDRALDGPEAWTLVIPRGQTRSAILRLKRQDDFKAEVRFGKETSGRNASHGVYVDNIGLSGLLVLPETERREFFITADPQAMPGTRTFFLTSEIEGKLSTYPILVEVR